MLGETIGPYRILEKLGQGGMGVVYKAEDTRLGRLVALKFLPQELSRDPQALERLRREARTASALNHPHIGTLHDIAEKEGHPFIVMELLDGQTLRQRLAAGKPMPPDQIVEIGTQMADALDAAHSTGIVHRDIKPANIFLTRRGQVKLMDFGLAKLARPRRVGAAGASELPTATATPDEALTSPGVAIGTVAYMSPEQARGEELDPRTDLFSLGAVLYEMATGRQSFPGPTSAVVFAAILNRDPAPPREINPELPERLQEIIGKALEKDRELRCQSASELKADLRRLKREMDSGRSATRTVAADAPVWPRAHRRRTWALVAGAAIAVFVMAVVGIRMRIGLPVSKTEPPRELRQRQLTGNPPENRVIRAAISPDGKMLAYAAAKGVFLQVIATGETQPLHLPEEFRVWDVQWYPDGSRLVFRATDPDDPEGPNRSSTWGVSILGGSPRKLRDDARGAKVSPDGSLIAFRGVRVPDIWVMGADGENPRKIAPGPKISGLALNLDWSPDGRYILSASKTTAPRGVILEAVPVSGGPTTTVLSIPAVWAMSRWASDGRILYAVEARSGPTSPGPPEGSAGLWEVRVDATTRKPLGEPRRIMLEAGAVHIDDLTLTSDAKRMTIIKNRDASDVYVGELRAGGRGLVNVRRLTLDDRSDWPDAWTPDSRAVVFTSDRRGNNDVFRQRLDQESAEPIVSGPGGQGAPVVTPDGSWILYWADPEDGGGQPPGSSSLMRVRLSGGPPESVLETTGEIHASSAPRSPGAVAS